MIVRELKMGFERRGEENCISHVNLHLREKVNIIGGPPGLRLHTGIKRPRSISRPEEEEEEEEYSLKKRRRHKKKQRDFFRTISEAGSASETDPTSPRKSSVSGDL